MNDRATNLELEDRLVSLHALSNANLREQLAAIARLDRREAWRVDGARCMADWLTYRFGYSPGTAKDYVQACHALETLPATAQVFADGLLSWDQLRVIVQFASPEDDEELAREAPGWSMAVLEAQARRARRVSREQAEEHRRNRFLRVRWNPHDETLRIWGRIPGADGRLVEKALDRIAEDAPRDPVSDTYLPWDWRCADALVEMASMRLGADADPDRASLVVHVDESALRAFHGTGELEGGIPLAIEVVRRLACDARVQPVLASAEGELLGVGRMSRTVPHWLLRRLHLRDDTCRFPGCERKLWRQAHHIHHWAHGGPTDEDNLILLCGFHHRLVHEGGWKIRVSPSGRLRFVRPDGFPLRRRPEPLRPRLRARSLGALSRAP